MSSHDRYRYFKGVLTCFLINLATYYCNGYENKAQSDVVALWPDFDTTFDIRTFYHDQLDDKLYIGAVDRIYVLDALNVSNVLGEIVWTPLDDQVEICKSFKSDEIVCQNNVRVLQPVNSTHMYTCGTMAFNPTCCYLHKESFTLIESTAQRGKWKISNNPYATLSSVIANGLLFTATRGNARGGSDGVISKSLNTSNLRTPERDDFWLNEPHFVGIHHQEEERKEDDKVFVFFREKAEEFRPHEFGMSTNPSQRNIVSRVASVCVNDEGGTGWVLNKKFATFAKMSISCVVADKKGDISIRYDNLVGTYVMANKADSRNPTLYGVFNGPENSNMGSAVCAYSMDDIKERLQTNEYWNQEGQYPIKKVYKTKFGPAPGTCVPDTTNLNHNRLTFSKNHPIKFGTIFPRHNTPLYRSSGVEYSHIAVRNNPARTSSFKADTTTIFLITSNGLMSRVIRSPDVPNLEWTLPDIQLFNTSNGDVVQSISIGDRYLFVATNSTLLQVPFSVCSIYRSCSTCMESRDPYCLWDPTKGCKSVYDSSGQRKDQLKRMSSYATCASEPDEIDPVEQLMNELRLNASTAEFNYQAVKQELEIKKINIVELENLLLQCHTSTQGMNQTIRDFANMLTETQTALRDKIEEFNNLKSDNNGCEVKAFWAYKQTVKAQEQLEQEKHQVELLKLKQRDFEISYSDCITKLTKEQNETKQLTKELQISSSKLNAAGTKQCKSLMTRSAKLTETKIAALKHENSKLHGAINKIKRSEQFVREMAREEECLRELEGTKKDIAQLAYINQNLSRRASHLEKKLSDNSKRIKRLRWLHKRHGFRGQQTCEHNGWFLSNKTGNVFALGRERFNYTDAVEHCANYNSRLAVFRNAEEVRYIHNVMRAFTPNAYFWIGLIKYNNGTLKWADGTLMNQGDFEKFPSSQLKRLRNRDETFCVEISPSQRWYLIPCQRPRRTICERHDSIGKSRVVRHTTVQLLPDLPKPRRLNGKH